MVSDVIMFAGCGVALFNSRYCMPRIPTAQREKARKKRKPAVAGKSILHTAMGDVRGLALCSEGLALY
jgi:hypothetical protein